MLLITAMNVFHAPLNMHVYGWLDKIVEDSQFPTVGMEPYSESKIKEERMRILRQLAGLTKGQLEITIITGSRGRVFNKPSRGWIYSIPFF